MSGAEAIRLLPAMLDRLMPMHLALNAQGLILSTGPTLAKLVQNNSLIGQDFFAAFAIRRLARLTEPADLHRHAGQELHLNLQIAGRTDSFRGLAIPLGPDSGFLINLSFGIGVIDAVRRHNLTHADFAPTDLAVEMLYVVEAKTTVMDAWKDLTLRVQGAKRAAEEQALTDPLTGLRNRRALDLGLSDLAKSGAGFGLMHIDLDYFKQVNDTLGHAAGDHVLRAVAAVLQNETRAGDTVARVGGDEFVLILRGTCDAQVLGVTARRIIDRLTQPIEFEGRPCRISASIGVTISSFYDPPEPERMLSDADEATYASKRAGRARAAFHAPQRLGRSA